MIQSNYYPNLIVFSNYTVCGEPLCQNTWKRQWGRQLRTRKQKRKEKTERSKRKERFKMKDEKREKRPIRKVIELEAK